MSRAAWALEGSGSVSEGEKKEDSLVSLIRQSGVGGSRPESKASACDVAAGPRGNGSPNLLLQPCGRAQPDGEALAEDTGSWPTQPSAPAGTGSSSPKLWIPGHTTANLLWQSPGLTHPLLYPDRVLISYCS